MAHFAILFQRFRLQQHRALLLIEDFNQDGILDILFIETYEYVAALGNGDGNL